MTAIMNSQFYTTTIKKATAVSFSESGFFISPTQLNLIVAKYNCLEIYLINEHGLLLLSETELYGQIEIMKVFRPKNQFTDLVFVVTAQYNAMIFEFTQTSDKIEIITKGHCNVFDNLEISTGFMAIVDHDATVVILKLFERMFKIIPLDNDGELKLKVYSYIIEDTNIQDIGFIHGFTNPTFIAIHENTMGRFIKMKEYIYFDTIKHIKGLKSFKLTDNESSMVIPVPAPLNGAIIVGRSSITYIYGSNYTTNLPLNQKIDIVCYTRVDLEGTRYLLGDQSGCLLMLFLKCEKTSIGKLKVSDLNIRSFGEISIPTSLTYLDNKVVFVASKYGDSQLIKLHYELNKTGSHITVLDRFINLGPIVDMCLVDTNKRGYDHIVTCSGAYKDGSLRIIDNGVEIQQRAEIDLLGIKGIWTLSFNTKSDLDDTLVLSFIWHSKVLDCKNEEFEEICIEGFETELQTFYCGKILKNKMVQITSASVRLICMESKKLISEWKIPDFKNINAVSCNGQQAICASGKDLYYVYIGSKNVFQNKHITLKQEVSCLDICLFKDEFEKNITLLAIGFWRDVSIKIFKLPDFIELVNEFLFEGIVPRSISFVTLENTHYLFCALGSGSLFYFDLNVKTGILCKKRKIELGNQPALIKQCKTTKSIFICSDYPVTIHSSNKKLVFTKVNSIKVNNICMINTAIYTNCLILATDTSVIIGIIDLEKKYHVRTIPLGESPRRIAYQESSKTFGIITIKKYNKIEIRNGYIHPSASTSTQNISSAVGNRIVIDQLLTSRCKRRKFNYNPELEVSNMIILHQDTFEILHVYQLYPKEYALSILSTKLGDDPITYYILGTALMTRQSQDPIEGRIIVFHYDSSLSELTHISEKVVDGGCFSMVTFHDMLVTTVNSSINTYSWTSEKKLVLQSTQNNNSISQHIKTNGNYILCGDLMKSLALFTKSGKINLERIVSEDCLKWPSAIEIIDDELFIGAENDKNLYIFYKSSNLGSDNLQSKSFQAIGRFHLGDLVNIFRHGSLVMKQFEDTYETKLSIKGSIIYGTVSGALGFITNMDPKLCGFMSDFQNSLTTVVNKVEKLPDHHQIQFTKSNKGFLDGNLFKKFFKLSISNKKSVIRELTESYNCEFQTTFEDSEISIKDVTSLIGDLTKIY